MLGRLVERLERRIARFVFNRLKGRLQARKGIIVAAATGAAAFGSWMNEGMDTREMVDILWALADPPEAKP